MCLKLIHPGLPITTVICIGHGARESCTHHRRTTIADQRQSTFTHHKIPETWIIKAYTMTFARPVVREWWMNYRKCISPRPHSDQEDLYAPHKEYQFRHFLLPQKLWLRSQQSNRWKEFSSCALNRRVLRVSMAFPAWPLFNGGRSDIHNIHSWGSD